MVHALEKGYALLSAMLLLIVLSLLSIGYITLSKNASALSLSEYMIAKQHQVNIAAEHYLKYRGASCGVTTPTNTVVDLGYGECSAQIDCQVDAVDVVVEPEGDVETRYRAFLSLSVSCPSLGFERRYDTFKAAIVTLP